MQIFYEKKKRKSNHYMPAHVYSLIKINIYITFFRLHDNPANLIKIQAYTLFVFSAKTN